MNRLLNRFGPEEPEGPQGAPEYFLVRGTFGFIYVSRASAREFGANGDAGRRPRIPLRQDQRRGDRGPQRKAAVHRQVGKIQDAEGQEDAQGHQGIYQPQFSRSQQCHDTHRERSGK